MRTVNLKSGPDRLRVLAASWLVAALLGLPGVASAQNLVPNGDFENAFAGWMPVEAAEITAGPVHGGAGALMVADTARSRYSYVFREIDLTYATHQVSFWVYPAAEPYLSAFELIADWLDGTAVFITRAILRESGVSFTAVDTSASISTPLTLNAWNNVTVRIDGTTRRQEFFVNDEPVAVLTSDSLPAIEHLLVGDLSITGMYGLLYYDDILIEAVAADPVRADDDRPHATRDGFALAPNFPNPFRSSTRVRYTLGRSAPVVVAVYDVRGRRVRTLVDAREPRGERSVVWDGRDDRGVAVPSGVYLLRLTTPGIRETRAMVLQP